MLDDRNITPLPYLDEVATWKAADNQTGWEALLGKDSASKSDIKPSQAPARMTDATGQPPAFIDCGELDIFRDEDIEYAKKLAQAGISCDLHIYSGVVHAFDVFAPQADVVQRAMAARYEALRRIFPTKGN
jgi:acetyl esterase/lipase